MLHRSNIIALVAGGCKQKFAENTVLVWDDSKKKFVLELTFASPVLAIRLRKDFLFVVEATRVHIFSFPTDPKKIRTIDTGSNPRGLFEVSTFPSSERQVMVYPGHKEGTIQVMDLSFTIPGHSVSPVNISAHQNELACIALNSNGTLVATASTQGTLIRVYDTVKKNLIVELRRGSDRATLYCINFSPDSDFLCASSDKGTVHIFALKNTELNRRLSLVSPLKLTTPYFASQWAFANFTVAAECACVCAFGSPGVVYAICVDGTYHKHTFNKEGDCVRNAFDVFVDLPEENEF